MKGYPEPDTLYERASGGGDASVADLPKPVPDGTSTWLSTRRYVYGFAQTFTGDTASLKKNGVWVLSFQLRKG
jgi:hypothetical protein